MKPNRKHINPHALSPKSQTLVAKSVQNSKKPNSNTIIQGTTSEIKKHLAKLDIRKAICRREQEGITYRIGETRSRARATKVVVFLRKQRRQDKCARARREGGEGTVNLIYRGSVGLELGGLACTWAAGIWLFVYSGSIELGRERESYSRGLVPLCFLWPGLTVEMGLLECEPDRDVLVLVFYWLMVFSSSPSLEILLAKTKLKRKKMGLFHSIFPSPSPFFSSR